MRIKRPIRTLLLTAVWTYAAATWASISHHLVGLPDIVLPAALAAAIGVVAWSQRPLSARAPKPAQLGRQATVTE